MFLWSSTRHFPVSNITTSPILLVCAYVSVGVLTLSTSCSPYRSTSPAPPPPPTNTIGDTSGQNLRPNMSTVIISASRTITASNCFKVERAHCVISCKWHWCLLKLNKPPEQCCITLFLWMIFHYGLFTSGLLMQINQSRVKINTYRWAIVSVFTI